MLGPTRGLCFFHDCSEDREDEAAMLGENSDAPTRMFHSDNMHRLNLSTMLYLVQLLHLFFFQGVLLATHAGVM
jgi:hypothetical protein